MQQTRKALSLVPLALLVGCGDDPPAQPSAQYTIPIGALVDNTGSGATVLYGAAATLATNQINEGIRSVGGSVKFDLQIRDSRGDATLSQMHALTLINDKKIRGLVSDISGVSLAANVLNYDASKGATGKVPIACYACSSAFFNDPNYMDAANPGSANEKATRDGDNWLFRAFFNSRYESLVGTRIVLGKGAKADGDVNGDGKFKIAILAQDDAFGKSSAAGVTNAVEKLHGAIPYAVETVKVPPTIDLNNYAWTNDFATLLDDKGDDKDANSASGKPDAVFLAVLPNLAMAAVKAYRESKYDVALLSTTAFRRAYILQNLNTAANGVEGNSPPLYVDDESGRAFNAAMVAANGEPPEQLCSGTYDAAATLMLASLAAGLPLSDPSQVTSEAVRDAMTKLFDPEGEVIRPIPADFGKAYNALKAGKTINYKGASGVHYDAAGENFPRMVHWSVEGGKFKELEAYDCSPTSPNCNRL
jgi:ABC-type branched-subunit amino acid transport system substrate-binding protein